MLVSKKFWSKMCWQFSQKKKKKLLLLLLLFCRKFWTCKLFLKKKKKKPCRAFLFEKSIGFSCKDLGKFSKNLFVFWKFLNPKFVENLVKFALENFDILIKICVSRNDIVLSFENLIKTLLGFLMKILANFLKACLFFENFWT